MKTIEELETELEALNAEMKSKIAAHHEAAKKAQEAKREADIAFNRWFALQTYLRKQAEKKKGKRK